MEWAGDVPEQPDDAPRSRAAPAIFAVAGDPLRLGRTVAILAAGPNAEECLITMIIHMLITWLMIISKPVKPYEVPPPNDIFHVAEGMWGWSTTPNACTKSPQRLTFTPDHSTMVIEWADDSGRVKAARYQLRHVSASTIRGFITDETRKTDTGELVVWDLVLTSPNSYRWHRTDWAPGGYTMEIFRCPPGTRLPIRAK